MSWFALLGSGMFEMLLVLAFKKLSESNGVKLVLWTILSVCIGGASFTLLSIAMREIDMSIAYAVWTGIGASGGVVLSSIIYHEKLTLAKCIFLAMIIASMVGLKLLS